MSQHIQPADHRVLVESRLANEAPAVASRTRVARSAPSSTSTAIVHDDGVWHDEPVWTDAYSGYSGGSCGCGGGSCGGGCASSCGMDACCGPVIDACCQPVCCNVWGSVELLSWWSRGRDFKPLATTGTTNDPDLLGQLDQPDTVVLFGGHVSSDARLGGRAELGWWLNPVRCDGVAVRYWQVGDDRINFGVASPNPTRIARPFVNVTDGNAPEQDTQLIAFPNQATGSLGISASSDILGGDAYYRRMLGYNGCTRLEVLLGYQMTRIDEDLAIRSTTTQVGTAPTTLAVQDIFDTRNEFHGGTIGFLAHTKWCCWTIDSMVKFGLGNMHQEVNIDGRSVVNGTTVDERNGLFARQTNEGRHSRNRFVVVPELNLNAACSVTNCVELTVGYSLLAWTNIVEPEDQIDADMAVNLSNPLVGVPRPGFQFNDHSYLLHGLNVGVRCRY